jgi:hypothetical protein
MVDLRHLIVAAFKLQEYWNAGGSSSQSEGEKHINASKQPPSINQHQPGPGTLQRPEPPFLTGS